MGKTTSSTLSSPTPLLHRQSRPVLTRNPWLQPRKQRNAKLPDTKNSNYSTRTMSSCHLQRKQTGGSMTRPKTSSLLSHILLMTTTAAAGLKLKHSKRSLLKSQLQFKEAIIVSANVH